MKQHGWIFNYVQEARNAIIKRPIHNRSVKCTLLQAILMAEKRILKSKAFKACRASTNEVCVDSIWFSEFPPLTIQTFRMKNKMSELRSYCGRSRQFLPWLLQITWSYQFLRMLGDLCCPACLLFLKLVALVGRTQVCAKWPTWSQLLWIRRPPESDYNSTSQSSCSFLQRKHWDSQWLKLLHVPENFWSCWMSAKRINPGCLCLPTMDRCQILCLTSSNCCRREGWGLEDQVLASSW